MATGWSTWEGAWMSPDVHGVPGEDHLVHAPTRRRDPRGVDGSRHRRGTPTVGQHRRIRAVSLPVRQRSGRRRARRGVRRTQGGPDHVPPRRHGAHADLLARLGPHTTGVGCLYVKALKDVDLDVLEAILARSYATLTAGTFPYRARESGSIRRSAGALLGVPETRYGPEMATVKVAAVQAAYVLMDQKACLAKAVDLLGQAAAEGAGIVVFPEVVHPGHPDLDRLPADLGRRRGVVRAAGRPGRRRARPGHRRPRRRRPRRRCLPGDRRARSASRTAPRSTTPPSTSDRTAPCSASTAS